MVAPRTTGARRRVSTVEPSEDTTKSKVVIPDGTKATIREQIGGKEVLYEAEIKEDDTQDQTTNIDNEDLFEFDDTPSAPPIPKSPLDLLFDEIQYAIEMNGCYDGFFAKLLRQPDAMQDRFNIPCRDMIDMGVLQFSTQDRFNFISAIQERNNNSGGRFSIAIYSLDQKPLTVSRGRSIHAIEREVGLSQLVIQNPAPKTVNDNNGNTGNENGLGNVLLEMAKMNQANHDQLMQVLNRRPEKSTLEAAIEQKVLNDILNPPERNNNNDNGLQGIMANVMGSIAVTQAMGDALAQSINRQPPPPVEKTWLDNAKEIAELPIANRLMERLGDIGEAVAVAKLSAGEQIPQPNPNQDHGQTEAMPNEQQELITDILNELESDNPLDATNETIAELKTDFPNEFEDLVVMCKSAPFESVFSMLIHRTSKMQPSPFVPYLDLTETSTQGKYVYNEMGKKIVTRLQELYEYLKTVN